MYHFPYIFPYVVCQVKADDVFQWIIGNTFPFVVFGSFGAFWLGWAATLQPFYNAYGAYSTTDNPADGLNTVGFRSSFGTTVPSSLRFSSTSHPPRLYLLEPHTADFHASILLHRYGYHVLHLPHLLHPHKLGLLHDFLHPRHRLRPSRRRLLPAQQRKRGARAPSTSRRRRRCILHKYPWVVDFCSYYAGELGLSV